MFEILKQFRSIGEHVARAVATAISRWTRHISHTPVIATVKGIP